MHQSVSKFGNVLRLLFASRSHVCVVSYLDIWEFKRFIARFRPLVLHSLPLFWLEAFSWPSASRLTVISALPAS